MSLPVLYAGDTVADMQTVVKARQQRPDTPWLAVGILPPHVTASDAAYRDRYGQALTAAGADVVLPRLRDLTPERIHTLISPTSQ
jgi:HAD superfamily phosphatase